MIVIVYTVLLFLAIKLKLPLFTEVSCIWKYWGIVQLRCPKVNLPPIDEQAGIWKWNTKDQPMMMYMTKYKNFVSMSTYSLLESTGSVKEIQMRWMTSVVTLHEIRSQKVTNLLLTRRCSSSKVEQKAWDHYSQDYIMSYNSMQSTYFLLMNR